MQRKQIIINTDIVNASVPKVKRYDNIAYISRLNKMIGFDCLDVMLKHAITYRKDTVG